MPISDVIISRNAHHYRSSYIDEQLRAWLKVGCGSKANLQPVNLQPDLRAASLPLQYDYEPEEWRRCAIWISPAQSTTWQRFESVIKTLRASASNHRLVFEVSGNCEQLRFTMLCHVSVVAEIQLSILSALPHCRMTLLHDSFASFEGSVISREFYPQSSMDESLTSHQEFGVAPLSTLLCAMSQLPASIWGCYQCIFEAADQRWRELVQSIRDLRYLSRLSQNATLASKQLLQSPSADLRLDSQDSYEKAHPDRPLFFVLPRMFLIGNAQKLSTGMKLLSTYFAHFQHGGRRLGFVDYANDGLYEHLRYGLTLREGFLVNSRELAGLVHVLSGEELEERHIPIELLDPVAEETKPEATGTILGYCQRAGEEVPIRIPPSVRERGTHIISSAGSRPCR